MSRAFLGAPLHGTGSSQVRWTGHNIAGRSECLHNENVLRHLTLPLVVMLPLLVLMARILLLLFAAFASASPDAAAAAATATVWSLPHQRRELFLQHLHYDCINPNA